MEKLRKRLLGRKSKTFTPNKSVMENKKGGIEIRDKAGFLQTELNKSEMWTLFQFMDHYYG